MQILINDPISSTTFIGCILFLAFYLSSTKKNSGTVFPISTTLELKGLAILMVVFAHIGYFLSYNTNFLFPLSIFGGIGVDIFLFLSGFGIAEKSSTEISKTSILVFYKKRLPKIYIPLWIALLVFVTLDFFVKNISYDYGFILKGILGIFQTADILIDFNSPLWYFTLILFYYAIFPLVFSKKNPWLGSFILFILIFYISSSIQNLFVNVEYFYKLHLIAFPLGVSFNSFTHSPFFKLLKTHTSSLTMSKYFNTVLLTLLSSIAVLGAYYQGNLDTVSKVALNSITAISIVLLSLIKKSRIIILEIFGKCSFEIYLIHWPIIYRYDFLYSHLQAWIATLLYLPILLFLAFILSELSFLLSVFLSKNLYSKI